MLIQWLKNNKLKWRFYLTITRPIVLYKTFWLKKQYRMIGIMRKCRVTNESKRETNSDT